MDDIQLKIEAMTKLGLINIDEAKQFKDAYKRGGQAGLKKYITDYAEKEEKERHEAEKKISSEAKALIKEDKVLLQKWRKITKKDIEKRSNKRLSDYKNFQKSNKLKRKRLEIEMAAADRKIDEIIDDATKKIELEITNKIREKLL